MADRRDDLRAAMKACGWAEKRVSKRVGQRVARKALHSADLKVVQWAASMACR